jgi:hypothetical protein
MSGPAVQLSFTLRTSPNVRTVHLLGSWDNYKNQLPLSLLKDRDAKPGSWKGTFRFQGAQALKLGSRYWYYYIVDGYHVSHDPAKEFTTEPTTGRKLNILDVPGGKSQQGSSGGQGPSRHAEPASNNTSRHSREIPTGRALSPGKIQHPKPSKPYESRHLREADYSTSPTDDLADRFAGTRISDQDYKYNSSPSSVSTSSGGSTTFSDSDSRSSPSSLSSVSSVCRCERYGITRSGQRVKLDCGGSRCGYSGSSSECSSENSEESSESEDDRRRGGDKRRSYVQEKAAPASKHGGGQKAVAARRR